MGPPARRCSNSRWRRTSRPMRGVRFAPKIPTDRPGLYLRSGSKSIILSSVTCPGRLPGGPVTSQCKTLVPCLAFHGADRVYLCLQSFWMVMPGRLSLARSRFFYRSSWEKRNGNKIIYPPTARYGRIGPGRVALSGRRGRRCLYGQRQERQVSPTDLLARPADSPGKSDLFSGLAGRAGLCLCALFQV